MITNDATLLKVKHEVLYEVAKLAYEGRLDGSRSTAIFQMLYIKREGGYQTEDQTCRG